MLSLSWFYHPLKEINKYNSKLRFFLNKKIGKVLPYLETQDPNKMKIFYADVIAGAVHEHLKACRKHVTFIKFYAARENMKLKFL